MSVRRWKSSEFPITLLAVLLLARGSQGSGAAATSEVSDDPSTVPSAPVTSIPPPGLGHSQRPTSSPRRKRAGVIFPSWLKNYDVYDDLAVLYGLASTPTPAARGVRAAMGGEGIVARQRPRLPDTGLEAVLRKRRKRRRRKKQTAKTTREKGDQIMRKGSKAKVRDDSGSEQLRAASAALLQTKEKPEAERAVQERKPFGDDRDVDMGKEETPSRASKEDRLKTSSSGNSEHEKKETTTDASQDSVEVFSADSLTTELPTTIASSNEMGLLPYFQEKKVSSDTRSNMDKDASWSSGSLETTENPAESTESSFDSIKIADALSRLLTSSMDMATEMPNESNSISSMEDDTLWAGPDLNHLKEQISKLSKDSSEEVPSKEVPAPHSHPHQSIRVRDPENLSPSDIVAIINADMEDVVKDDQKDMATLAQEESKESRTTSEDDDGNNLDDEKELDEDEKEDDDTMDDTEARERYRVSDQEEPPEPATRPNYTHEGAWARPPPDVDIDFVPLQILAQVRRYDTVRHLTPEDALAEASTDEEVVNAPRLKEVVSHRKTSEVYSEEGYEDSGYDHGGYNKEGEHHEVVPGFEASAIMIKPSPQEEGTSTSRDHEVAGSLQKGTILLAPGDRPKNNHTHQGSKQTTRGSWSVRQVAQDDDGRSVVLQEGGNITSPTTLSPVFPSGRYAAKHITQTTPSHQQNPQTQQTSHTYLTTQPMRATPMSAQKLLQQPAHVPQRNPVPQRVPQTVTTPLRNSAPQRVSQPAHVPQRDSALLSALPPHREPSSQRQALRNPATEQAAHHALAVQHALAAQKALAEKHALAAKQLLQSQRMSHAPQERPESQLKVSNSTATHTPKRPTRKKQKRRKKKRKHRKQRKNKKASKIPPQLLGFKYPADRKKPRSKSKNNSPLAKAKRKRKRKEREKRRRKMSRKKLDKHQKQSSKLNQTNTHPHASGNQTAQRAPLPPKLEDSRHTLRASSSLGMPVTQVHATNHHPNLRHDTKWPSPSVTSVPSVYITPPRLDSPHSNYGSKIIFPSQREWPRMEVENLLKPPPPSLQRKWERQNEPESVPITPAAAYKYVKPVHFTIEALASSQSVGKQGIIVETEERKHINLNRMNIIHKQEPPATLFSKQTTAGKGQNVQYLQGSKPLDGPANIKDVDSSIGPLYFSTGYVSNAWKPVMVTPHLPEKPSVLANIPTQIGATLSVPDGEKQVFQSLQRRLERSLTPSNSVSSLDQTVPTATTIKATLSNYSDFSHSANFLNPHKNFPKTEAVHQLESRVIKNLGLGTENMKQLSSYIKHVPPVLLKKQQKYQFNVTDQDKLRLLKVMDMEHWKNLSKLDDPVASTTKFHTNTSSDQHREIYKEKVEHELHGTAAKSSAGLSNVPELTPYPSTGRDNRSNQSHPLLEDNLSATLENENKTQQLQSLDVIIPVNSSIVESYESLPPNSTNEDFNYEASEKKMKFVLPDVRTNVRKYPFYMAPKSDKLTSYTPLRYAVNPYDVPIKSDGGMEFYESRDNLVHCEEPRKPEDVIPERDEDGEWNKKPQPDGPRMGNLGDAIGCMRVKLFGENPLDNPFFKETSVGLPQETALVGALVDARGTPAPKLFDQFGFYTDILDNIRHASIGPNPEEVENRPYIQVGASPLDSDEASSEVRHVKVSYNLPEVDHKDDDTDVHTSRSVEDAQTGKELEEARRADALSELKSVLQESVEEEPSSNSGGHLRNKDKDSSESTSVEYYVDSQGRPIFFHTGGKIQKSNKNKNGKKGLVYHNIVRPASSEDIEYTVNSATQAKMKPKPQHTSSALKNKALSERGKSNLLTPTHRNKEHRKQEGLRADNLLSLQEPFRMGNSYKQAQKNSKAITEVRKKKVHGEMKFLPEKLPTPPMSTSVLQKLKTSNVSLEQFLKGAPDKDSKHVLQPSHPLTFVDTQSVKSQNQLKHDTKNISEETEESSSDEEKNDEDIISSESSDFVRPKNGKPKKTKSLIFAEEEGVKFGSDEFKNKETFRFTQPIGKSTIKNKTKMSGSSQVPSTLTSMESKGVDRNESAISQKGVLLGIEDDSVVELPLDSSEETSSEKKSKTSSSNASNMKDASSEVDKGEDDDSESNESDDNSPENESDHSNESEETAQNENASNEANVSPNNTSSEGKAHEDQKKNEDQKSDEDSSAPQEETGTESKPITFEEFKASLTPDELEFFKEDDDEDDDDDLEIEDDPPDIEEETEKPKKIKTSKTVQIVRVPDSDEFGKTGNKGEFDTEEDRILVNYTSNLESDIKPEKNVKLVKVTEENFPDDDYEYDEEDYFDTTTPKTKTDDDRSDTNTKGAPSETIQTESDDGDTEEKQSDEEPAEEQRQDFQDDEPDDDKDDDYYDDDDYDDGSHGRNNEKDSAAMNAEESKEEPNYTTDGSLEDGAVTSTARKRKVKGKDGVSLSKINTSQSSSDSGENTNAGESNNSAANEEGGESSENSDGGSSEGTKVNSDAKFGGETSNSTSEDILPFESAESAVEQKSHAELAFDEKVNAAKSSILAPVELTQQASNTQQTKTSFNASVVQDGSARDTTPVVKTQLGVSSLMLPLNSSSASSPTLTVDQWVRVASAASLPPAFTATTTPRPLNLVMVKAASKPAASSVIMTIPSSRGRGHRGERRKRNV